MRAALFILSGIAAALAWYIARRRPEHRPIAWALSVYFASSIVRAALIARFPPNLDPAAPLRTGASLAAAYADRALFIAWPCAIAATALRVLAGRPAWPVAIGYGVAALVLILGYPALRFQALRTTYLTIEVIALAVGIVSVAVWYREGWRRSRSGQKEPPDYTGRIAAALVLAHFATILTGPYRLGLFGEEWALAQLAYVAIFAVLVLVQLGEVLTRADR